MSLKEVGELPRETYLGGSDIAAIMGLGAYGKTPYSTYLAKIGEVHEEMDPQRKKFLERRKRWEGPIVEMLREEFDAEIVGINHRYQDSEHPFLAAEIDFEWRDHDGAIQNGEIKTVSPFAFGESAGWGEPGTDEIPVHYAAQVMHGLGITQRTTGIVAAMVGLDSMIFYRVERDDETIADMRERAVDFWQHHVIPRVPPEPVSLTDVMQMTRKMSGKPVDLDDEMAKWLKDIAKIRANRKAFEDDEKEIAFHLFNRIRLAWGLEAEASVRDNAVLLLGGQKVATWNRQQMNRLDLDRLRAEKPEIAAAYRKTSETRVLRISKEK